MGLSFDVDSLQKALDELEPVSASGQLDLSLAFKQPDEVKTMTAEEVQEFNALLQKCGSKLRLKSVKWCDLNRKHGKVYGACITDFRVLGGTAQGDVDYHKQAYVLADGDQKNDTMALVNARDLKFTIQFKDVSETMTLCAFVKNFGLHMSRLGHNIHNEESLDVKSMTASVSQITLGTEEFVPMVNPYGSSVLVVLFFPGGVTAGVASGHRYNFLLAENHGKKDLLAAKIPQGTPDDEKNDTGKRMRDDGPVFIAEDVVGKGWFCLLQIQLEEDPTYAAVTRGMGPRSLVECCVEMGPKASSEALGYALKDLPLHGLELDPSVPPRLDIFNILRIVGDEGALAMKDVQKMLVEQRGMYNSLNASPHTREKLQNLGVIGFSAMTPAQIEFLKGLGCSTDTMTLSEQKKGFELIKDLDQLFEAFTIFKIMTKHVNFAGKILEIHAENKDLALDLGKELLKLVADDDTVEEKFPKMLECAQKS